MRRDIEISCYYIIWITSVLFSIYSFSRRAKDYFQNYVDEYDDFTRGIEFLSTSRDKSDLEWESISYLLSNFFPCILVYISVAEICRRFCKKKVLQTWQIMFTLIYVLLYLGCIPLFLVLVQPIFFLTIKRLGSGSVHTWIGSGMSIACLIAFKSLNTEQESLDFLNLNENKFYLLTMALFWLNLRCMSFALDQTKSSSILDVFSYSLYPPTLFTGPWISLKDFQGQNVTASNYKMLRKFVINLLILLLWVCFGTFCLHFIYVNSASFQIKLIESLDSWSLYGYGYTMGQFFHLKYVILYGLSTSIASFENIKVPHLPRCIGRIHLYSDMWKYFDPGLYKFLLRYIYVPLIKQTDNKPVSSLFCFGFVFVWHGLEMHILIWTALNYLGVMLETILWPESRRSHKNWGRRIDCLLAVPLLAMSAISNFYFFAGREVGDVFFKRIFTDQLKHNFILFLILYCCCQVSTDLRCVPARKL